MTTSMNQFNASIHSLKATLDAQARGAPDSVKAKVVRIDGRDVKVIVEKYRVEIIIEKIWDAIVEFLRLPLITRGWIKPRDWLHKVQDQELNAVLNNNWSTVNSLANHLRRDQNTANPSPFIGNAEFIDLLTRWNEACRVSPNNKMEAYIIWNADAFRVNVYPTKIFGALGKMVDDASLESFSPTLGHYYQADEDIQESLEIRYGKTLEEMGRVLGYNLADKMENFSDKLYSLTFANLFTDGCFKYFVGEDELAKMSIQYLHNIIMSRPVHHFDDMEKIYKFMRGGSQEITTPKSHEEILKMSVRDFLQLTDAQRIELIGVLQPHLMWLVRSQLPSHAWLKLSDDKLQKLYPSPSTPQGREKIDFSTLDWSQMTSFKLKLLFPNEDSEKVQFRKLLDAKSLRQVLGNLSDYHLKWLEENQLKDVNVETWTDEEIAKIPVKAFSDQQLIKLILHLSDDQVKKLKRPKMEMLQKEAAEMKKGIPNFFGTPTSKSPEDVDKWKKLSRYVVTYQMEPIDRFSVPSYQPPPSSHNMTITQEVHSTPEGTWVSDGHTQQFYPGANHVTVTSNRYGTSVHTGGRAPESEPYQPL